MSKRKRNAEVVEPAAKKSKTSENSDVTKAEVPETITDAEDVKKFNLSEAGKKLKRVKLFSREINVITRDKEWPMPGEEDGNAFIALLNGRRKSGKTFLSCAMMLSIWLKEFDRVYILSETALYQEYFKKWKGKIKYLSVDHEWNMAFFEGLKAEQIEKKKEKALIYIDDVSEELRQKDNAKVVNKIATMGRHFRISCVWLTQKITLSTPCFRQEADAIILFREENHAELILLHRDWGFGTFNDFSSMIMEQTDKKYGWIMLRNMGGKVFIFRRPTDEEMAQVVAGKTIPGALEEDVFAK